MMNGTFSASILRMWAIVRTDCILRFRRISTLLIFVAVCALAYFVIPDPVVEKMTFMQLNGHRVLYTSDSIAIGTVTLQSMVLILLMGFYMVSSSIRRDIQTRTGSVIAATAVRNWEYLLGKCIGNIVFLVAIMLGYMMAMMVMHLLRADEPLQPLVYLKVYFVCSFSAIVFVSVIAVVFEVIPLLSGKLGNVIYFFLWTMMISIPMIGMDAEQDTQNPNPVAFRNKVLWSSYIDAGGLAFVVGQVQSFAKTTSFSIGRHEFDDSKTPVRMNSITLQPQWIAPRLISTIFTLPLLFLSMLLFHRFDPIRIRYSLRQSRKNLFHLLNHYVKPLSKLIEGLWRIPAKLGTFNHSMSIIVTEVLMTLHLYPVILIVIVVNSGVCMVADAQTLQGEWLPALFCMMTIMLADLSLREHHKGMTALLYTMPGIRQHFVWWKNGTALLLTGLLITPPLLRFLWMGLYSPAISLVIGAVFISITAIGLGLMTGTSKTFMGLALFFYYLALNSHGQPAGFDFAGWFNTATFEVQILYVVASFVMLFATQMQYMWKLRRSV